jgi:hypothetical protein
MSDNTFEYDNICDEIKAKVSLVDEMEKQGLSLKVSGRNRMKCVCPFHDDSDPSLSISLNTDIELFYCFGCGEKGSVIDFIMKINNFNLTEAIGYFCKNYNLEFAQGFVDLDKLISRVIDKKGKFPVIPFLTVDVSCLVKRFLDESDNPLVDFMIIKSYLKEIDEAAEMEDQCYLLATNRHLENLIAKIKEKRVTPLKQQPV